MMNMGNTGFAALEDFTIAINGSGDRWTVRMNDIDYPNFPIPYTREEVENALNDFSSNRYQSDPLTSIGSTLFNTLFSGEIGRELWRRLAEAERKGVGLRLRILSNFERAQHLPWELLFDPSRNDFMLLSGRVAIVRTRPDMTPRTIRPEIPVEPLTLPVLRVLAVSADPTGHMRTEEDLAILQRIASENPERMVLTVMQGVSLKQLTERLQAESFDVFHFAGMGEVLPEISKRGGIRQALRLMNPDAEPGSNWATAPNEDPSLLDRADLGAMLHRSNVRLAVLNACHTDWVARSVAKFIPSVIGMRETVTIESCLTFCDALYRGLLAGSALDSSVTIARQSMNRAQPGMGDWCKVICYLQQPSGDFLLSPLSRVKATEPVAASGESKDVLKLTRLLDVYERNLDGLKRNQANAPGIDSYATQADDMQRKVDSVRQQLADIRGNTN